MKYVKSIEDFKRYSFEFFDSFLEEELSDLMVNSFLLGSGDRELIENEAIKRINANGIKESEVCDYGEVILQLSDYRQILKRFVEFLLKAKQFLPLSDFLNRIFLQRIGNEPYRSSRKEYTYKERYFDRFVEIIRFCNISKDYYIPFFFAILGSDYSSPLYYYKEPLKEYLDGKLLEGDASITEMFNDALKDDEEENSQYSLSKLIDDYFNNEISSLGILRQLLSRNVPESMSLILDRCYDINDEEGLLKCVELLSLMSKDKVVREKLKEIYSYSFSNKVKSLINKELGSTMLESFNSEAEFLSYVDAHVSNIQDRLYGIRLDRFYNAYGLTNSGLNGKVMTFVLQTFRNKEAVGQVEYFRSYFKYVDEYVLVSLCNIVYDIAYQREKLLSSKWAMRLISTFASNKLLNIIFVNIKEWMNKPDLLEPCQYFIDMLSLSSREDILSYIKKLYEDIDNPKMKKYLDNKINAFSVKNKEDLEQIKDKLVDELGFDKNGYRTIQLSHRQIILHINSDCSVSLLNGKSEKPARIRQTETYCGVDVHTYVKNLEKKIKEQKKRLYASFLEFRNYDYQSFVSCIVENRLLNFLSQHLFWGRYKKDKLVEICLLQDDRLVHVAGNVIDESGYDNYSIAILQSMDCQDIKDRLTTLIEPLFDQFEMPIFMPSDINQKANCVSNLNGVFCNGQLFITRLQKIKYKIADLDDNNEFSTLIKINTNLNLVTTVEFDRVRLRDYDRNITLSLVRFYELGKMIKNGKKFAINKQDALILENINPHVLSNELALILSATIRS